MTNTCGFIQHNSDRGECLFSSSHDGISTRGEPGAALEILEASYHSPSYPVQNEVVTCYNRVIYIYIHIYIHIYTYIYNYILYIYIFIKLPIIHYSNFKFIAQVNQVTRLQHLRGALWDRSNLDRTLWGIAIEGGTLVGECLYPAQNNLEEVQQVNNPKSSAILG